MRRTTIYLPDNLKLELEQAAAESGESEAAIVREGIRLVLAKRIPPLPTAPLFSSGDPRIAENVDEYLVGFGER